MERKCPSGVLSIKCSKKGTDDDHAVFYCSNDGEEYAKGMGGILCPEGPGEVPTCPDGKPCVCIDVDGSCTDGDDDWGYTPTSTGCVYVNHQYDNPGTLTCDCVEPGDPCFDGQHCVKEPKCIPGESEICPNHCHEHKMCGYDAIPEWC